MASAVFAGGEVGGWYAIAHEKLCFGGVSMRNAVLRFNSHRAADAADEQAQQMQQTNKTLNELRVRVLAGKQYRWTGTYSVALRSSEGPLIALGDRTVEVAPCRAKLPTISKLSEELKDKGVAIYGVNDEDAKTARKYLEGAHLNVTTLDDSAHKVHAAYRVNSIPTVFVIGPDGKVVQWLKGGHSEKSLRAAILQAGHAE